jgi:hypothetical protein
MTGPAWLRWPPVGRLAGDRDHHPGRTGREARSPFAASGRLQAEAAMNRCGGPGQNPAVGHTRPGNRPGDQHLRRMPNGAVLVCRDTAPAEGWGG